MSFKKIASLTPSQHITLPTLLTAVSKRYPGEWAQLFKHCAPDIFSSTKSSKEYTSTHTITRILGLGYLREKEYHHLGPKKHPLFPKNLWQDIVSSCHELAMEKEWVARQKTVKKPDQTITQETDVTIMFKLETISPDKHFPGFDQHVDDSKASFIFNLSRQNLSTCPTQLLSGKDNPSVVLEDAGPLTGIGFNQSTYHRGLKGTLINPDLPGHRMIIAIFFDLGETERT